MARGDGNAVSGPSASPFPQPICERDLAQTSVAGGAGSWCEHLNPFILPRPVDVPAQLDETASHCEWASAKEEPSDGCTGLTALGTAELAMDCSAGLAAGSHSLLCSGGGGSNSTGEREAALSLLLLGSQSGHLLIVDAASRAAAMPPVAVLPAGRPLAVLHAASFQQSVRKNAPRPHRASIVLAGDAATLQVYVLHAAGNRGGEDAHGTHGTRSIEASQCSDGTHSLELAAEGLALRAVAIAPVAEGADTVLAAALLAVRAPDDTDAATSAAVHQLRLYRLTVRTSSSRCGLPAAVEEVARHFVDSSVAALPVRLHLLGAPPRAHVPVRRTTGSADVSVGTLLQQLQASVASSDEDFAAATAGGDGGGGGDGGTGDLQWCINEPLLLYDRGTAHLVWPCAGAAVGQRVELRAGSVGTSRSLVHAAEPGWALTAAATFYEHFGRSRPASSTDGCLVRTATWLEGCEGVSSCRSRAEAVPFCRMSGEGGEGEGGGSGGGEAGSELPLLWLAVAKVRVVASGGGAGGSSMLQLVALPELGSIASDEPPLPAVRCGLPSDDANFHLNWYWPRLLGASASGPIECEARPIYDQPLESEAVELHVRFRRLAELGSSEGSAILSSAAEEPCDLLLDMPSLGWLRESCVQHRGEVGEALMTDGLNAEWLRRSASESISESQRYALRTSLHHAIFVRLRVRSDGLGGDDASVDGGCGDGLCDERGAAWVQRSRLAVYGAQERLFTAWGLVVSPLTTVTLPGESMGMHVSPNGLYAWVVARRERWELESVSGADRLCAALQRQPDDPFLSAMGLGGLCGRSADDGRAGSGLGLFGWELTACPAGALCPSFSQEQVYPPILIAAGLRSERGYAFTRCTAGSFCVGGQQVPCPPGYQCPEPGMAQPLRCPASGASAGRTTCFDESRWAGVVTPRPCVAGRLCVVPYAPGLPVPPGWFADDARPTGHVSNGSVANGSVANGRGAYPSGAAATSMASSSVSILGGGDQWPMLRRCRQGEWCPLGRYGARSVADGTARDMRCPAATFCGTPTVVRPLICNFTAAATTFCPAGSASETLCAAGHFCTRPDRQLRCSLRSYCPEGSLLELPCPAGHYCPNASVVYECPAGFTCREGTVVPRRCFVLTSCPAGSASEAISVQGPLVVMLSMLAAVVYGYAFRKRFSCGTQATSGPRRGATSTSQSIGTTIMQERAASSSGVELQRVPAGTRSVHTYSELEEVSAAEVPQSLCTPASAEHAVGRGVDVAFEQLSVRLRRGGRTVLHPACGKMRRGELTAVMGPSGSGKTTLLTALAGRVPFTGQLTVDGEAAPRGIAPLLGCAFALVPQEDVMFRQLTVEENVWLSAAFRLRHDAGVTRAVERVLSQMNLLHVRHSTVGDDEVRGVSGGERKRTNISLELVAEPACIFIDEPTTGLDASAAKQVVACIAEITQSEWLTVACVVHQPRHEVVVAFRSLLLLARGGRVVYQGAPLEAAVLYAPLQLTLPPMCSLSDFLLDIVSDARYEDAMHALWRARNDSAAEATATAKASISTPSQPLQHAGGRGVGRTATRIGSTPARQLALCVLLHLKLRYRRLVVPLSDICAMVIVSFVIGLRHYDDSFRPPLPTALQVQCPTRLRKRCSQPLQDPGHSRLALVLIFLSLQAALGGANVFAKEPAVVHRYGSWGVAMSAYVVGGMLVHLLDMFTLSAVFTFVAGQIWGARTTGGELLALVFLSFWAASAIGHVASTSISSPVSAKLTAATVILVNFVISQAIVPLTQLPSFVRDASVCPS